MAEGGQEQNPGVLDGPTQLPSAAGPSATLAEGEHVHQKFTNSPVNVLVGDEIHGNKVVNITTSAECEATTKNQENISSLIESINKNTMQKTKDRILQDFCAEELSQPDFEVNPQMRRVKRSEYFKGKYEQVQDMVVKTKTGWFWKQKTQVVKNQFRKEFRFCRQQLEDHNFITLDEILKPDIRDNSVTVIVASAGSGKTTLMRRMARRSLEDSCANQATTSASLQSIYKFVHYVEVKDIQCSESIKPSKFLFGGLLQNEIDEEHLYQWMLKNQSEAIIFFDGLDQATWEISKNTNRKINPFSSADAATIMGNILSRNILPGTKIVISSREFQISDLPAETRPDDIIRLLGLTLNDAQKLFVFLIGKEGENAWERIESMSPRLLNLVSIPVFLVLTAVIMSKDPTKPPPNTVTELYKRIISTLSDVKNIINADDIVIIIKKLQAMAYRGMEEGRVVFYEKDLQMFGISKEEVRDLMMKVPGNKLLSRNLVEGDFIFFFCHQSLQEFLAAVFVAEMAIIKFMIFNNKHLHKERWSVVRRFVCGIIYDNSPNQLHEVSNRLVKQRVLGQSIRWQHWTKTDVNEGYIRMELYTAIYESNDDGLMKQLSAIDASGISLSRDEAHIIGSLAASSKSLICFNLFNCKMKNDVIAIIAGCLEDQKDVKEVNVRLNNFSATALRSLLGHRRIESLAGKLHWKVVLLDSGGVYGVKLRNEEAAIKITGIHVDGHFNIEDSTLVFKSCANLPQAVYLEILFEANGIQFPEYLYATHGNLSELSKTKLGKISNILLDCTEEEVIDWSLIENFSKKIQAPLLNIAVNGQTSADDYKRILEGGMKISVFINIHAMFYLWKDDHSGMIVEACQQNKIKYIRCIFSNGCCASFDEISSLVNNSNLKNVTLIYTGEDDMLKGDELKKMRTISNDLGTELEVTQLQSFRQNRDGCRLLDYKFHNRENERRQKMNKR